MRATDESALVTIKGPKIWGLFLPRGGRTGNRTRLSKLTSLPRSQTYAHAK